MTDQLWDLRDNGVAESGEAVHSSGKPIIHSTYRGWGQLGCPCLFRSSTLKLSKRIKSECQASASDFVGVGNNPNTGASVWRSQPTRRNVVPFRIIPDAGQVSEKSAKPTSPFSDKQVCDVFQDNEARSKVASESKHFSVETAAFAFDAGLFSTCRKVLAWESATNDVNGNSIGSKAFTRQLPYIVVAGHMGPVLGQDATRKLLDLAERDGLEPASPLQTQREAADAAKQVEQLVRLPAHAAAAEDCSEGRVRGEAAAAAANSSNDAYPATTSDCQCSAGMLLRCAHERAVWSETPRSSASASGPALLTISECVLIVP